MNSFFAQIGKGKATLIHFVCSACMLFLVFLTTHWLWYPGPLLYAANALDIMTIIVLVDLSLGPAIMFAIFKPGKASLKFDISIIIMIQIAFLGYGCFSIFEARPVFIVYVEQQFNLVTANEIDPKDLEQSQTINSLPWKGPLFVGANSPTDATQIRNIQFARLMGLGLQNLPQQYTPIESVQNQIKENVYFGEMLLKLNTSDIEHLKKIEQIEKSAGRLIGFIPMRTKKKPLYVVIDREKGNILRVVS